MRNTCISRALAAVLLAVLSALAQSTCPINYGGADNAKPNKLYLYFPAAADNTYPEFGIGGLTTSPAAAFDTANLTSYTGNAVASSRW